MQKTSGPPMIGGPLDLAVVDRPLSIRRQADVLASPFFDLPPAAEAFQLLGNFVGKRDANRAESGK
jgi:hypothetical protein